MNRSIFKVLLVACVWVGATDASAQIRLAGITEAKGGGAVAGGNFRNGYQMAIQEINASGGVLGQRLEVTQFDIDTKPEDAVRATTEAVAAKPFAILGPVFSGLTAASMGVSSASVIPQFTGGEAASLSRKYHPGLLRTSLTQAAAVPRLVAFAVRGLGLKQLAILYVDNDFGRDGKDLMASEITRRGAAVVLQAAVKPGTTDFAAAVTELRRATPDALLLYVNEGEAPLALKELRKQGFDRPVLGDGPLVSQSVLDAAGDAADGVLAHTGISLDVPTAGVQEFVQRYTARYGKRPDHNSVKGWFAVQVIKAVCKQLGRVDQAAFLALLKEQPLSRDKNPALLSSASYDYFGDLNRDSYFVRVEHGRTAVLATMRRTESSTVELPDGRLAPIDSRDFHLFLAAAQSGAPLPKAGAKPAR